MGKTTKIFGTRQVFVQPSGVALWKFSNAQCILNGAWEVTFLQSPSFSLVHIVSIHQSMAGPTIIANGANFGLSTPLPSSNQEPHCRRRDRRGRPGRGTHLAVYATAPLLELCHCNGDPPSTISCQWSRKYTMMATNKVLLPHHGALPNLGWV